MAEVLTPCGAKFSTIDFTKEKIKKLVFFYHSTNHVVKTTGLNFFLTYGHFPLSIY